MDLAVRGATHSAVVAKVMMRLDQDACLALGKAANRAGHDADLEVKGATLGAVAKMAMRCEVRELAVKRARAARDGKIGRPCGIPRRVALRGRVG